MRPCSFDGNVFYLIFANDHTLRFCDAFFIYMISFGIRFLHVKGFSTLGPAPQ